MYSIEPASFKCNCPVSSDTCKKEIAVSAKITNLELWKQLPEVEQTGEIMLNKGKWIVTGRIACSDFKKVQELEFVKSLKVSTWIAPFTV